MMRPALLRRVVQWLLLLCLSGMAVAQAAPPVLLGATGNSMQLSGSVEVLMETGPSEGINAIARKPDLRFMAIPATQQFDLNVERTLWIRLTLERSEMAADDWTLHLPLPYLDYAALYVPDGTGSWRKQVAGDTIAVQDWTYPELYPDFVLDLPARGAQEVYLEVRNFKPVRLPIRLATKAARDRQQEIEHLGLGILVGMMLMLIGVCSIHYLQSRSVVDGWYTAYASLILLVIANATGLSGMWLWPTSPMWSN